MVSSGMAYLLWCLGCIGLCGIHRFYLGKPLSGVIWLFTVGLFGFGQLIDLILIPGLAAEANSRRTHVVVIKERR
jgi:TM2 domain-containing membrane protein YozV